METDLVNKVSLITGSSRGIGASIARKFSQRGATVILTYHEQREQAESLANEICAAPPFQLDVRNRQNVRDVVLNVVENYRRIDVLVNNAGINRPGDFNVITDHDWDEVVNINLKGTFICCQEALPYIPNGGRIINIGSLSGEYGGPRTPSYAASKAGVMALTHCLARFLGPRNITVNCVSPGVVESELTNTTLHNDIRDMVLYMTPLRRLGQVQEIAEVVAFIASDAASYLNAQTISVNGGTWVR